MTKMCSQKKGHHASMGKTNNKHCGCEPALNNGTVNCSKLKNTDTRFRDFLLRTNIDLAIIAFILAWFHACAVNAATTIEQDVIAHENTESNLFDAGEYEDVDTVESVHTMDSSQHALKEDIESPYAILYPWFVEITGVFVYFFLSRYAHAIPYTAVMFIVGFFIGFSVQRVNSNGITDSTQLWLGIEGELVVFAFPMVLGGTTLTALVAYYIFPYGWSFDLCMTFGSILAATDPVAVAVLLNELGAPPRLKMHISGESLMNDGSAVVFYIIFSARFLFELGLEGVGEDIGWGKGFELFFRLAFGGVCIGVAFGIGVVYLLFHLDRRLSGEDSVLQVVTTISAAYLAFFTSEILAHCSGIIAVLFCGVTVKAFGETLLNDTHLTHHFWEITEHLLNTLLFALGGCVWGDIISSSRHTEEGAFEGKDWGYLVLLYVLLIVIRFFLIFVFYPITKRIGIGTNVNESCFAAYGGLRGAVGIALALSLYSEVVHLTSSESVDDDTRDQYREYTAKLFGFVGGVALLTLVINASSSGPLLIALGLVTPTETRKKVIENYRQHMIQYTLLEYVKLMTEERFQTVDFTVMKEHIPFMRDITYEKLMSAVQKYKDKTSSKCFVEPSLEHVIPYLYESASSNHSKDGKPTPSTSVMDPNRRSLLQGNRRESVKGIRRNRRRRCVTVYDLHEAFDEKEVREERMIFIQVLRSTYHRMIEHGELESRGFMPYSMFRSLDFAADAASKGLPLNDWDAVQAVSNSWTRPAEKVLHRLFHWKEACKRKHKFRGFDTDFLEIHIQVRQVLAFTRAHESAQKIFKEEFTTVGKDSLTAAEKNVLDESKMQMAMADKVLNSLDKVDVQVVKSHYACHMLLNKSAYYFEKLAKRGLVTEREASEFIGEVEEDIFNLLDCREATHKDQLSLRAKKMRISSIPTYMMTGVSDTAPPCESDSFAKRGRKVYPISIDVGSPV